MLNYPMLHAVEAVVFTLGCVAIQSHRDHAERMTEVLAVVALVAFLSLVFSITPVEQLNMAAAATAMADMGIAFQMSPR